MAFGDGDRDGDEEACGRGRERGGCIFVPLSHAMWACACMQYISVDNTQY